MNGQLFGLKLHALISCGEVVLIIVFDIVDVIEAIIHLCVVPLAKLMCSNINSLTLMSTAIGHRSIRWECGTSVDAALHGREPGVS